jgi:TRAP-type C4-dicarboxylate transport system permease small subunit
VLHRAEVWAQTLARLLAGLGLALLICFAVATLVDGLMRSLADRPIDAVADVAGYVVAVAVAACFPLAHLRRANITIEIAGMAFGPHVAQWLRGLAALLVTLCMVAIARQMLLYAGNAADGHDSTVMLSIPTAPFWYLVALMFVVAAAIQALVAFIELARCLHHLPALPHSHGPS